MVIGFSLGIGPIPWLIMSEVYRSTYSHYSKQKVIWRRMKDQVFVALFSQCLQVSSCVLGSEGTMPPFDIELWLQNLSWMCNPSLFNHAFQILPVNIKGLAGSIATMANWLTAWGITMTANLLLTWSSGGLCARLHLHVYFVHSWFMHVLYAYQYNADFWLSTGTFTIYTVVAAFTVAFTAIWVPETKGRTSEEIQFSFR